MRRISDEDAERLLVGFGPDENGTAERGELGAFVRAVSATVPSRPPPELGSRLVPRLAEAASAASLAAATDSTAVLDPTPGMRAARPQLALAARAAVAVALVPVLATGLAFAGVTLPGPARSAFEGVGIDLPNQAAVDETSATEDATGGQPKDSTGNHGGNRGAQRNGAKGKSQDKSTTAGRHGHGHGRGHGASPGNSASAPGQQGTAPGLQGTTPGQGGTPPGQGGTPPGQSFQPASPQGGGPPSSPPGQSKPKP